MQNKLWRITLDTNPEDCNLSCIMCEEHSKFSTYMDDLFEETGVRRRRMPLEWLDNIFEQAKQLGIREIIPSTMGEPLLYKGIGRIYELAQKHNIKINLTTNGTFPGKTVREWAEIIVPYTSDVKISWNGATKSTAEKVMPGLHFEKALKNLEELIEYRDYYYSVTNIFCRVTLQLTFMKNNVHELAEIIKMAAKMNVDRIKGHHLWTHFEELEALSLKSVNGSIPTWNNYVKHAIQAAETYRKPDGSMILLENIVSLKEENSSYVPDIHECPFLGKELWISATGKISPCCAPDKLRNSLGDFGNIQNQTIEGLVNGNTYRELQNNYKKNELCKTCNMRKAL